MPQKAIRANDKINVAVSGSQSVRRRRIRVKIGCLKIHPLQGKYYQTSPLPKIQALADDIERNGLRQPVLAMPTGNAAGLPGGTIIDGHDRVAAAKLLGWTVIDVEILDDMKQADASTVETMYLSINLTRKQLDRLDQARAVRRLFEIEKARKPGTLRRGEQPEARDRVGTMIGMSGKNLERYWNVLKAPLEVQRFFQGGQIKLEYAARIGLMRPQEQAALVGQLHGVTDAKAIKSIVQKALGLEDVNRHRKVADAVAALSRALDVGIRDLEGRLQEIRPRVANSHAPVLNRAADLIEFLLGVAGRADESNGNVVDPPSTSE
jgi:ParB-like chromosome segregation protein Spo0J